MMARFVTLLVLAFCILETVYGQLVPDQCFVNCTSASKKKPPVDISDIKKILPDQYQDTSTETSCPQIKNITTAEMDETCAPVKQEERCLTGCDTSSFKTMRLGVLKVQDFICFDRPEDIKKHLPCLSQGCQEVKSTCITKCGYIGQAESQANLGKTCATINCLIKCSEPLVTKKCGNDAYSLHSDLIRVIFTQTMTTIRTMSFSQHDPWPEQCKPLIIANDKGSSSTTAIPSILLLIMTILAAFRNL